jgi:hypothetical protein
LIIDLKKKYDAISTDIPDKISNEMCKFKSSLDEMVSIMNSKKNISEIKIDKNPQYESQKNGYLPEIEFSNANTITKSLKKKKTYQKICTPETIEQTMKTLRSKYPLFPNGFEDKLYTTDGEKFFVEFKKNKIEITDGGVVLKLINSLK